MGIIQIRPAQREGARLVIGLSGVSGSGKTYTALQLAYGLANGKADKVGFLDTENRRGSLYADALPQPFLIADLYAPFSPARYSEAIAEFQRAGVEVLVIDSVTHEWEGIGGAQEIAEAGNPRLPNWNRAKAEHKRFMNALLTCDMHVIVCIRAREKAKPEKVFEGGKEKTVYVDLGLQPIQEKNFVFELTAGLMLHDAGTRQDPLKIPADLVPILGRGTGYLTAKDGRAIRAWVDGAKRLDPAVERGRNAVIMASQSGEAAMREAWGALTKDVKAALGVEFRDAQLEAARGFDRLAAEAAAASAGPGVSDAFAASGADEPPAAAMQTHSPDPGEPGYRAPAATPPAPAAEPAPKPANKPPVQNVPRDPPAPKPAPAAAAADDLF